jgi:hypothetical protein
MVKFIPTLASYICGSVCILFDDIERGFCVLESTIDFLKLGGILSVFDGNFSFVCFQKVKMFG